jgi:ribosome maturation factor RimP
MRLDYHIASLVRGAHIFGVHPKVGPVRARFFSFLEERARPRRAGAAGEGIGGTRTVGRKEDILEKVRQIASPLAEQEGLELIEVEFGGGGGHQTLRLYIDKKAEGGVTLDNCTSISHSVSAALDVEDPIIGAYDLEVSSPGLDRPLRTPAHFQQYAGERVRVKTYAPISEQDNRKTFVGKLNGYEEGFVIVDVDGKVFRIPHAQVSKANVEPNFDN